MGIQKSLDFPLPVPQSDPPRSPQETLPTMYDLPSEDPEEPGSADMFHYFQPQLLQETFRPPGISADRIFAGGDVNLYYDVRRPLWYKRPDWYAVLGVPRLYDGHDLRLSYVIWQEQVSPFIVVELLSPNSGKDDLGQDLRLAADPGLPAGEGPERPPTKWEVYERILRVPYYVVYDRYSEELRAFGWERQGYRPLPLLPERRLWLPEIALGVGLWYGFYRDIERNWLRWYGEDGQWLPTEAERENRRAEAERQRADEERRRGERLAERLRALGIDPE